MKPKTLAVLLAAAGMSLPGCMILSTGARSAAVQFQQNGLPFKDPILEQAQTWSDVKSLLSEHFLWPAADVRAAQWIAIVDVKPRADGTYGFAFQSVKKNPTWDPLSVSSKWPIAEPKIHPSLDLSDANRHLGSDGR